ncbi:Uncharacterized protein TCM_014582 [Theobroma cacao]|uniref:Uncharacterized protein n=1 Tax=Theobroma cacao TaxID=3641 RepID=A0A061G5S8_THECC|nr:Uncharacterized protein TCM_014582 [Theobroma cacao]
MKGNLRLGVKSISSILVPNKKKCFFFFKKGFQMSKTNHYTDSKFSSIFCDLDSSINYNDWFLTLR